MHLAHLLLWVCEETHFVFETILFDMTGLGVVIGAESKLTCSV